MIIWLETQQKQALGSWGWPEALNFLLWQGGLACEVMEMEEPKEEAGLNVCMLWGRVQGRGPKGTEVPGPTTCLPNAPSSFKCRCLPLTT